MKNQSYCRASSVNARPWRVGQRIDEEDAGERQPQPDPPGHEQREQQVIARDRGPRTAAGSSRRASGSPARRTATTSAISTIFTIPFRAQRAPRRSSTWSNRSYHSPTARNDGGVSRTTASSHSDASRRRSRPRAHGRGEHHASRALGARPSQRRHRGRAGRDAVVHDDGRRAGERRLRAIPAVQRSSVVRSRPPASPLPPRCSAAGTLERLDDPLVEDPDAGGDGADRELGVVRRAELVRDHDVERAPPARRATGAATITPPRGIARTIACDRSTRPWSAAASALPASSRSRNTRGNPVAVRRSRTRPPRCGRRPRRD